MRWLRGIGCALAAYIIVFSLIWLIAALAFLLHETDWSGEHVEVGPVPLTRPGERIERVVNRRQTIGGDSFRLLWDEGQGPVKAYDRIKPLLGSVPKELQARMRAKRDVPAKLYATHKNDPGTVEESLLDSWGIVVSLNPDVMIVSLYERPIGPCDRLPREWDMFGGDEKRRTYLSSRVESVSGGVCERYYAGTLVPSSTEMHIVSTEPKIGTYRLQFENDRAVVALPSGKLVLNRQGSDVEVTRE